MLVRIEGVLGALSAPALSVHSLNGSAFRYKALREVDRLNLDLYYLISCVLSVGNYLPAACVQGPEI